MTKRLLSVEDGLASREVFCGLQDRYGFNWFGTRNGLNRYNGKKMLLFTRQHNGLQQNRVTHLAHDNANHLLLNPKNRGLLYRDNGIGLPEGTDFNQSKKLGLRLIKQLSKQLHGVMFYQFESGSVFELQLKDMTIRTKGI